MYDKRINIFTGHFGSGKTEVAVNFALKLQELDNKTAIIDFDIVNPFFRTIDAKCELESKGIWVITPRYANTNVDVPALPPEINTIFEKKEYKVVFDVGGDDLGAKALSRYKDDILADDSRMFFVINTRRPMTDTPEKIEEMLREIEGASRLKIDYLINNTNILTETTAEDVLEGHKLIHKVSEKLNIPIAFTSGFTYALDSIKGKLPTDTFYLNKLIKLPWD